QRGWPRAATRHPAARFTSGGKRRRDERRQDVSRSHVWLEEHARCSRATHARRPLARDLARSVAPAARNRRQTAMNERDLRYRPPVFVIALCAGLVVLGVSALLYGLRETPDRVWPNVLLVSYYLLSLGLGGIVF